MELNIEKIEERALELYPVKYASDDEDCLLPYSDENREAREAYIKGWRDAYYELNKDVFFWP